MAASVVEETSPLRDDENSLAVSSRSASGSDASDAESWLQLSETEAVPPASVAVASASRAVSTGTVTPAGAPVPPPAPVPRRRVLKRPTADQLRREYLRVYFEDEILPRARVSWTRYALYVDPACQLDFVVFMCRRLRPHATLWVDHSTPLLRGLRSRLYRELWGGHWRVGRDDAPLYAEVLACPRTVHVHCVATAAHLTTDEYGHHLARVPPGASQPCVLVEDVLRTTLGPMAPGWLPTMRMQYHKTCLRLADLAGVWGTAAVVFRTKALTTLNQAMKRILAKLDFVVGCWAPLTEPMDVWRLLEAVWTPAQTLQAMQQPAAPSATDADGAPAAGVAEEPATWVCRLCLNVFPSTDVTTTAVCTACQTTAPSDRPLPCPRCDRPMEPLEHQYHPQHICHVCCLLTLPGGRTLPDMVQYVMAVQALQWFRSSCLGSADVNRLLALRRANEDCPRDIARYRWRPDGVCRHCAVRLPSDAPGGPCPACAVEDPSVPAQCTGCTQPLPPHPQGDIPARWCSRACWDDWMDLFGSDSETGAPPPPPSPPSAAGPVVPSWDTAWARLDAAYTEEHRRKRQRRLQTM